MFSDIAEAGNILQGPNPQAHFHRPEHKDPFDVPTKYFLRKHFEKCLHVHLRGGNITDDYTGQDIVGALIDVGIWYTGQYVSPDDEDIWTQSWAKK